MSKGFDNISAKGSALFPTVHRVSSSKTALNSVPKYLRKLSATPVPLAGLELSADGSLIYLDFSNSAVGREGYAIKFVDGNLADLEMDVVGVDDATGFAIIRNVIVGSDGSQILPDVGCNLHLCVYQTPEIDADGNVLAVAETIAERFEAQDFLVQNYTVSPVDSSTWVELTSSSPSVKRLQIFDSSGQIMQLGFGGVGSEAPYLLITPGGNGVLDMYIPAGTRISVKANGDTADAGTLIINLLG